ncbi:hypothetical protein DESHY_60066 [Desulforamulus hydrothermalis Lam5 = DSM 18033]|uniref:Uncharacterized protein n=1 Tax=Desulforamulus hydrothermalis Lam5 = DSM 18033 TaxID=1121428 RepID=K8E070_9FIRM|nr:hypothetical protein DESHY_60066 [Desulforamulus hydrothermalis Lam5 = DSM 18033]
MPQEKQWDGVVTTDRPRGTRTIHTFKKLPVINPRMNQRTYISINLPQSFNFPANPQKHLPAAPEQKFIARAGLMQETW